MLIGVQSIRQVTVVRPVCRMPRLGSWRLVDDSVMLDYNQRLMPPTANSLAFTAEGKLPTGDHPLSLADLRTSLLVEGPGTDPFWDSTWRMTLVDNLEILAKQLWRVGVREIYIDSSFAEDVSHPNDIDGYFVTDFERLRSGELQWELNSLDPHRVWNWSPESRKPAPGFTKKQLPMWHFYHIELYPHVPGLFETPDAHGNEFFFPASFHQCRRDGDPKGIIKLLHT